jgi:hypothetical protein
MKLKVYKYDDILEINPKQIRIQSRNTEFIQTGKIPKGMKIEYLKVYWNEVWDFDPNDDIELSFSKSFKRLKSAYALAFELASGYTNHTELFARKEIDDNHVKGWVDKSQNPRITNIFDVRIDVFLTEK